MTPEAKHIVSELRREFYSLFAIAMKVPVRITGTSYSSNSPIASWIDGRQRLNYVNVYPYIAPDEFIPLRPFILRLAINKSAGRVITGKNEQECRGPNLVWDFELTVLPREILDFLPWIVNLVKANNKGSTSFLQLPPHAFELTLPPIALTNQAWTAKAWHQANSIMSQQDLRDEAFLPQIKTPA